MLEEKPLNIFRPTGGTFSTYTNNGEMIVCGGFADGYRDQCDIYNFEYVTWRPWENTLSSPRAYAASAFLNETHWWYTGKVVRIVKSTFIHISPLIPRWYR